MKDIVHPFLRRKKIGLITFSDGRKYIHDDLLPVNQRYQDEIAARLTDTGEFEVICARETIGSNAQARDEAKYLRRCEVEVVIFNYAIWCYPSFSAVAASLLDVPVLLFCNLHPSECGMVGMLAAGGALDQTGVRYKKLWGAIADDEVLRSVTGYLRAASTVSALRGMTFGNFGGRALGMYTAVSNTDQWQKEFGIDVENIEQEDIVRYGALTDDGKVEHALEWLEEHVGEIKYDGEGLTRDKLRLQIKSYYGLKEIIREKQLDFIGIKAHGDLTYNYVTMDLAEAFLNDPYDFDGPHEPVVAATEADMDGALTMQIFKLLTGSPVLFADVRHYDKENDVWFFSNSGTHATFFAGASYDPEVNLSKVTFYPEKNYYPAGGASVHHFAAPGSVTLARLARKNGKYKLTIVPAEFVSFSRDKSLELGSQTTPEWPAAFARLKVSADYFIGNFPCNHIHGVYGDHVAELKAIADIMDIECTVYDGTN
ncbi:MAG: L-fucose/L-arabinose isomerase family protein [Eubacteriales bacterium]|nr:L-fucose/L-arabinose isomerase family protein [Eubacteriales bacterium]MDD4327787.1 L-fucose/L-arabinose isomerase family protein [Eubacteriales bacterium]